MPAGLGRREGRLIGCEGLDEHRPSQPTVIAEQTLESLPTPLESAQDRQRHREQGDRRKIRRTVNRTRGRGMAWSLRLGRVGLDRPPGVPRPIHIWRPGGRDIPSGRPAACPRPPIRTSRPGVAPTTPSPCRSSAPSPGHGPPRPARNDLSCDRFRAGSDQQARDRHHDHQPTHGDPGELHGLVPPFGGLPGTPADLGVRRRKHDPRSQVGTIDPLHNDSGRPHHELVDVWRMRPKRIADRPRRSSVSRSGIGELHGIVPRFLRRILGRAEVCRTSMGRSGRSPGIVPAASPAPS